MSGWEKVATGALWIVGIFLPGGGYASGGKAVVNQLDHVDEVADALYHVDEFIDASDELAAAGKALDNTADTVDDAADVAHSVEQVDDADALLQVSRNEVHLDANSLMRGLEAGELEALEAALDGRSPVISIRAAKEFLKKGDVNVLREFLTKHGGRIGKAATAADVQNLQHQAKVLGRVLHDKDGWVVGSAFQENLPLITQDKRLRKYLKAVGLPVEGF